LGLRPVKSINKSICCNSCIFIILDVFFSLP